MPQQFHDESGPSSVNHTVVVYGQPPQDAYAYVAKLYDAHYENRCVEGVWGGRSRCGR